MQRSGAPPAVLLEAQVDRGERAVDVCDIVDDEPALKATAAAPLTGPAETAHYRVARVALKPGVITWLELSERAHGQEVSAPPFVSVNPHRKVA